MEVRLNKMEMTVSICHFYNFFYSDQFSHHHPHPVFMDQCNSTDRQWEEEKGECGGGGGEGGVDSVRSLKIIYLLTAGGAFSMTSFISSTFKCIPVKVQKHLFVSWHKLLCTSVSLCRAYTHIENMQEWYVMLSE